ncbi:MAG: VOC family protein [Candidatus Eisenbacteria bacterium]|nr:VOC family protein [Candidatus Eisenbacteria bacterium]
MAPSKVKYVHTNLTGCDWRRLVSFYCDVFGCVSKPPERDLSGDWLDLLTSLEGARVTGVHLRLPGFGDDGPTLEIFSYDQMLEGRIPATNEPGFGHLAFSVCDVDEALRAVLAHGGSAVGEVTTTRVPGVGVLHVVYARDPEGNIIELQNWS